MPFHKADNKTRQTSVSPPAAPLPFVALNLEELLNFPLVGQDEETSIGVLCPAAAESTADEDQEGSTSEVELSADKKKAIKDAIALLAGEGYTCSRKSKKISVTKDMARFGVAEKNVWNAQKVMLWINGAVTNSP